MQVNKATHEEKQKAYDFWCRNDRSFVQTAKQFDRDRKTLTKWAESGRWEERADKIDQDIADAIDRKIVKEAITNVKLAQSCLNKEVAAYLDPKKKTLGRLRDIVLLFNYIDKANGPNEIADAIRDAAKQEDIEYNPALAREVVMILRKGLQEERLIRRASSTG